MRAGWPDHQDQGGGTRAPRDDGYGRGRARQYILALPRQGAGNEAAVTAASIPPLSGGPDIHGSAAAHAITLADSADGDLRDATAMKYFFTAHPERTA